MTVQELRDSLAKLPGDLVVVKHNGRDGYHYIRGASEEGVRVWDPGGRHEEIREDADHTEDLESWRVCAIY